MLNVHAKIIPGFLREEMEKLLDVGEKLREAELRKMQLLSDLQIHSHRHHATLLVCLNELNIGPQVVAFIHSLIPQSFYECLFWTRLCARHRRQFGDE